MIYQLLLNHLLKIISITMFLLSVEMNRAQEVMTVTKNDLVVKWSHSKTSIQFEVEAPTQGWVAIGFNELTSLNSTYLIMGAMKNTKAVVEEYYVFKPGDYQTFRSIGTDLNLKNISGSQDSKKTIIKFSLPNDMMSRYTKLLSKGASFNLLMAYSTHDDFEHHSIMRTSLKIKL